MAEKKTTLLEQVFDEFIEAYEPANRPGKRYAHSTVCPSCRGRLEQTPPGSGHYKHEEGAPCHRSLVVR